MKSIRIWMSIGWLAGAGVASGFYANITIDGDFADWNGVPAVATDPADNTGSTDFLTLQAANDENYIYVRYTLNESVNPQGGAGVYLAVDEDNNTATGFDPFGLGVVGSDASWQNDFAFEQGTGIFNTGNGLSGATYAASPYNAAATSVEISIPRTATHTVGGTLIFPTDGQTIRLAMWTEEGADDLLGGAYTFDAPLLFTTGTVANVAALSFGSATGVTYRLEYVTSLLETNWTDCGYSVVGNGSNLFLFDPTGFSTSKMYRIGVP